MKLGVGEGGVETWRLDLLGVDNWGFWHQGRCGELLGFLAARRQVEVFGSREKLIRSFPFVGRHGGFLAFFRNGWEASWTPRP